MGLPEQSLEVAVLQHPWRALFTPQELAEARRRLEAELAHLRKAGDQYATDLLERALRQIVVS